MLVAGRQEIPLFTQLWTEIVQERHEVCRDRRWSLAETWALKREPFHRG